MTRIYRFIALSTLLLANPAAAQTDTPARFETGLEDRPGRRPRRGERVDFNLENGDLMDLVRMMTRITGRRFLVTGTPRQLSATVASTEPVSAGEAYQAFLEILHLNGLTVVRRGRYHVITDSQDIPRRPLPVISGGDLPFDERFVTWIHRVRHVPVADATQLLEGLRSTEARLMTYAPSQTLIVIDTGANIRRMRRILREIDVPGSDTHIWVEPIHHANASEVAELLVAIFESPSGAAPTSASPRPARRAADPAAQAAPTAAGTPATPLRILSDERTNSLILMGSAPDYRRAIELLRAIDRSDTDATTTVRVRRLQHANAENVTATLQSLLGSESRTGSPAAGARPAAGATASVSDLGGRVRVEAHADLNAVVITATPADYRVIEGLVRELDVAPRQVFLEMVLMELTIDDRDQVGVNLLSGVAGLGELVGLVSSAGSADALTGLALGLTGPLVSDARLPGGSAPSFGVMLQALASTNQANIISTPYVLALDNRQALINIGQNVPLQGSSVPGFNPLLAAAVPGAADAANGASALQALSGGGGGGRRDTGTIVHVTPHINDAGEIRLEIQAEDSRSGGAAGGNLAAAILNQSIAETELVAQDGQTVVIGGLMRDSVETIQDGIPVLSDIPILGLLFGSTSQHTVKRNLLFFITPHIIRGPRDMRAIFERRMRERREFLERHMAFRGDWEPPVDYSRTRGLVGEMLDVLQDVEREAAELAVQPAARPEHAERPPLDAPPDSAEIEPEATTPQAIAPEATAPQAIAPEAVPR